MLAHVSGFIPLRSSLRSSIRAGFKNLKSWRPTMAPRPFVFVSVIAIALLD